MANPFFAPGDQRAAKVGELFGAVARRYDLINDLQSFGLHRCWKHRLARQAGLKPGHVALDLCCGTGDVMLALGRHGPRVVGLDFSPPMLAVAARRLRRRAPGSAGGFLLVHGDALQLPFPDDCFDAVTISYGLRNLADVPAGLKEMWRVTKRGGRILVLDFGKPECPVWRRIYLAYLRCVVPWFGRCFCGSAAAYAYIAESLAHYPDQQGVAELIRTLGGSNLRVANLLGGAMSIHCAEKPIAPVPPTTAFCPAPSPDRDASLPAATPAAQAGK
jgi:demethylmenaquinone methyltransferase/2-methoxy-6-polyprenyl-1,4-benzoquinol methylase